MFRNFFAQINSPSRTTERTTKNSTKLYKPQSTVPPFDWYVNKSIHGDCITAMGRFPDKSIDTVITDPPYLVNFVDRTGRSYRNDDPNDGKWLLPAFREMYRVLKDNSYCISFYGTPRAEWFLWAWREAGFKILEQVAFIKHYPSSSGHVQRHHELAYVLAKGRPTPNTLIRSVIEFPYSGNKYHPSQKPLEALVPLVTAFSRQGGIVLDPFAGSFSTCIAARQMGRRYIGIELSDEYYRIGAERMRNTASYSQTQLST